MLDRYTSRQQEILMLRNATSPGPTGKSQHLVIIILHPSLPVKRASFYFCGRISHRIWDLNVELLNAHRYIFVSHLAFSV